MAFLRFTVRTQLDPITVTQLDPITVTPINNVYGTSISLTCPALPCPALRDDDLVTDCTYALSQCDRGGPPPPAAPSGVEWPMVPTRVSTIYRIHSFFVPYLVLHPLHLHSTPLHSTSQYTI
ncbi:hypothetical protein Pmani_022115 [Petrolisthes manimaculis]|uniref:Uncharacterized protein n=1 Tax=Petrolisthes manimaculis TaxID=1843537 RepID=A0AAE1U1H2_9EUCA|nr:hypothetical protein Pmani_022115 [Petrolisthes manimaculis]